MIPNIPIAPSTTTRMLRFNDPRGKVRDIRLESSKAYAPFDRRSGRANLVPAITLAGFSIRQSPIYGVRGLVAEVCLLRFVPGFEVHRLGTRFASVHRLSLGIPS